MYSFLIQSAIWRYLKYLRFSSQAVELVYAVETAAAHVQLNDRRSSGQQSPHAPMNCQQSFAESSDSGPI